MRVKLEDVCERGTSSLMQKDIVDKNGKYPVYGASGRIGSMETYQQEHQTVAVVKDGAGIGRTMLLPEKSSIIGTMQYLIPKNCIEPEYLYYAVKYMHLEKYFSGATIPHIYFRDYKTEEFNLHNKTEQQEIISTLKRVEAVISNRREQLAMLDELVKARFVEMFGDPVNNPLHWKKVKLSELADIKIGPFGSLLHKEDYVTGGHPLVNPSHIIDGKIIVDNDLTLTDEKYSELISYHLKKDDIVLGRRGEMGRCAVVDREGLLCGTGSLLLRPTGVVTADYIQKIISFPTFKKTIEAMAVGQTMPNLNVPIVSNFMIILPPLSVQKEYYDFVAEVDKSKLFAELFAQSTCILAENHSK
ncbi:restriction endonuclease subunit S [Faecalibacterium prausnitzii]|uniref:restriction endonuclease subunit S n=1 Tax=Faecalibacterium prausnitzii TaxID=853 RepID=UPI001C272104|nr:restriction endonuclease subunit S [Faecalibacterium prausnitzii]MBV0928851.1 restriction endonuclease subunit S [Faecalibacterium prausnitzii]MCG4795803.1 restriction endonuclease subunit S [Faecalibacterium prausnitzii]